MAVDSLKGIFLIADVNHAVESGGLTAPERTALAKRFGVSEEVLFRYECAEYALNSLHKKQQSQAREEAGLRMRERGGRFDPEKFAEDMEAALCKIQDATPENEITREHAEALAALEAAINASTRTKRA